MATEKERMLLGELYNAQDETLLTLFNSAKKLLGLINASSEAEPEYRIELFRKLFKKTGPALWIEPPFYCDYGCNITVGNRFYANYDCIIIDVCDVIIGDNVFFGPRVSVYTASHPIDAHIRDMGLEFGKSVSVGNNVWVGGNTVINPGVTICDGSVIGSGSVVTRDIPPGVVAAGNPCRVLRAITDEDARYWADREREYRRNRGR